MSKHKPDIAPEEIRAIRRQLGLSQTEASELIGGGPRAFTKYEAGTVKPAASVINLLRILEANPAAIKALRGDRSLPIAASTFSPFDVTGEDIAALSEHTLPEFVRRLLDAEAEANDLPAYGVHVASNIYAADGGEDGRITWEGGPTRTPFLPSRLCQFQFKAGEISPAEAASDVLTKERTVKDMVLSVLEEGGHYIMLCSQRYTQRQIEAREGRIREALRKAGIDIDDDQVDFRDADQIATWTKRHPSIALWVREQTRPGIIGPFRSWSHWSRRAEHRNSPWVEDERLPILQAHLQEQLTKSRKVIRLVGLSGIGKSRLVLEALGREESKVAGRFLSDIVMYAVLSEVGSEAINSAAENLADSGRRGVLVVDNCDPETHRVLTGMVLRENSRLSLVTIDDEIPTGTLDETTLKIDEASSSVTEGIINHVSRNHPPEDQRRLARFSKGFPEVAIRIGKAWDESIPIAHAANDTLVETFVLGRRPREPELLLRSAALLAAFGPVRVEHPADGQMEIAPPVYCPLSEIASLGRGLTHDDLHFAVKQLAMRGTVKRQGRLAILQPRPIAMKLAEQQWEEWGPDIRDRVLSGGINPGLKTQAARQLAFLNTTEVSREVVEQVCRVNGPFDGFAGLSQPGHAKVLSALAEISPEVVADQIERSVKGVEDLSQVRDDVRRNLVQALERIAFHPDTFEAGARLLLRLAVAENETWANNATGQFTNLFPMLLGGTAADGNTRHSFLDEIASPNDSAQRVIVAEALIAGCRTHHFYRMAGVETQGARPAMESWHPATSGEAAEYIQGCVMRLVPFAIEDDKAGAIARSGLGQALRPLVLGGFIDTVETVTYQVSTSGPYWPQAVYSLRAVLAYDAECISPKEMDRVRALVVMLEPKTLESRIRSLVTEMSWDYLVDEELDLQKLLQRQNMAVRELALELLEQPHVLSGALPGLSRGEQRMAYVFGKAVAESDSSPLGWLEPLTEAVVGVPECDRNYDMLAGFLAGLANFHPAAVDAFKERVAHSSELAPALPQICCGLGISASDIQLVIGALQDGLLPPLRLSHGSFGGVLAKVPAPAAAPLFDMMLDHSAEGFAVALDLMGLYAHGEPEKLNGLRPQVQKLAQNATLWKLGQQPGSSIYDYHFEQIMSWMLSKGREDSDATATALALAKAVVDVEKFGDERLMKPVIPMLLSGFPEIAWQLIGQAIVSDRRHAALLKFTLGDQFAFASESNPVILNLPQETLFAWCHAHPDRAPAFLAEIVPVLTTKEADVSERSLHPVMERLLDEFGEREDVRLAIDLNIHTFGWMGSMTTYFALYMEPLNKLVQHPKPQVRSWAKAMLRQLDASIANARSRDEEQEAMGEV